MGSLLKDSVISFFKIMIDHDFLTFLYLPPKFARTTPGLVDKKTYLENLNGRWNVVVTEEKGCLVIRNGWLDFAKAHNLEIGDFVVFHYFLGNYFLVQVFKKTACDLRGSVLGDGYASRRSQSVTNPVVVDTDGEKSESKEDSPCNVDSNDSVILGSERENVNVCENKNATEVQPLAIVPVENRQAEPTNFEEPEVQLLMMGSYSFNKQWEDRTVIDLSDYEMPSPHVKKSNSQATQIVKYIPFADTAGAKCKVEPDRAEFSNPREERRCEVVVFKSPKRKDVEGSLYSDAKKTKYDVSTIEFPSSAALLSNNDSGVKKTNPEVLTIGSDVKKIKDDALAIHSPGPAFFSPITVSAVSTALKSDAVVKVEKKVKTELLEETDWALETASASNLHCLIKNPTSVDLELPGSLPLYTSRCGTSQKQLVILRNPAGELWPVFYHHNPSLKLLTRGWTGFLKDNHIQSGDECIFKAGSSTIDNATYDVSIVRKNDRPT